LHRREENSPGLLVAEVELGPLPADGITATVWHPTDPEQLLVSSWDSVSESMILILVRNFAPDPPIFLRLFDSTQHRPHPSTLSRRHILTAVPFSTCHFQARRTMAQRRILGVWIATSESKSIVSSSYSLPHSDREALQDRSGHLLTDHPGLTRRRGPLCKLVRAGQCVFFPRSSPASSVVDKLDFPDALLTASWDSTLRVFDPRAKSSPVVVSKLPAKAYSMDVVGTRAIVAMAQRHVWIWDVRKLGSGDPEPEFKRESSLKFMMRSVRCSADAEGEMCFFTDRNHNI
jgi:hypothetical protein